MSAGTIAFIKLLIELIPIAVMGLKSAKEIVDWGLATVRLQVSEGRNPTQSEWDELNNRITDMRTKLHSDTE